MAYTAEGLAQYCETMLKEVTRYMWGGLMRPITQQYITAKAKQYPKQYTQARQNYLKNFIGKGYGADCVGLIKSYYFGGINSPKYELKKDLNTNGMYAISKEKGAINTLPEQRGLILYMPGHVGVYIGKGYCIECTWGAYGDGVVKTKVQGRGWTHWLRLPYIEYPKEDTEVPETQVVQYTVKKGDSLWAIAKRYYGYGAQYWRICEANDLPRMGAVIHPGDVLDIPLRREV